jgi:HlyD family secretion protein
MSEIFVNNEAVHTSEVKDIISQRPTWVVQNGIMLFLAILLFMLTGSYFIKYPDIEIARTKLISLNPPVELKTKITGKLVHLYKNENDTVTVGEVLAEIESVANAKMVISLRCALSELQFSFKQNQLNTTLKQFENNNNKISWEGGLGELQNEYQNFIAVLQKYKQYLNNGFYQNKKKMLDGDIAYMKKLENYFIRQRTYQNEDLSLAMQNFTANETLHNDKVISALDYRNEKSKLINKSLIIPQTSISITNAKAAIHNKKKEISELENEIIQQKNIFEQALNTFFAQIAAWENTYLIKSPVEGIVIFTEPVYQNQTYQSGKTICMINPYHSSFFAQLYIPQSNFGKIAIGQEVNIKLAAYPYQDFGVLKGKLSYVSKVASDSGFIGKVELVAGFKTNRNIALQFKEGLNGNAEIITSNKTLLRRLLNPLRSLLE